MNQTLDIAFFGSSLVSAYWNGAATYYRGLVRALHERGHRITFYEPDAYKRQENRDMPDPDWAKVVVYSGTNEGEALRALESARGADLVIKASGVGVFDELLERAVLDLRSARTLVVYLDVDAPATLERIGSNVSDPFRSLIPQYDLVLTYGGGIPVIEAYQAAGARECVPIYNALDPNTHFRSRQNPKYRSDLTFLGNRMPDREQRVEEFFLKPAAALPDRRFLLGGNGWEDKPISSNVTRLGHVFTRDHNAVNSSALTVLNINRGSMARYGFSPPTRVFEAAGAGACLITDEWEGIELFLEPGEEVLVAKDGAEVGELLRNLTPVRAREIGRKGMKRLKAEHTYAHRADQVEKVLEGRWSNPIKTSETTAELSV
jgi:spore maturation protein CgeB